MATELQPAALTEDEVRQHINRWNGDGFFRIRNLGDKIFIDKIVSRFAYTVRLRTQYEERATKQESVPYQGGSVDDYGRPPGMWELSVRQPTDFEDRTETLVLPHRERVSMCPGCAGMGRTGCSVCAGSGRVKCPKCQGRGFVERQEINAVKDSEGNVAQKAMAVREDCGCVKGHIDCHGCGGNGQVTCRSCAGSGKVKVFENLTVRFHATGKSEVQDNSEVPDTLLGQARGHVVVDARSPRLDASAPIDPDVDLSIDKLLRMAQQINEGTTKILFQSLHVERVDIHEVQYRYAGAGHRLWVYGNDRQIHAPKVPWLWQRLLGISLGILGGLVLVILLIIFFASR